jgi:hypothetical protein
LSFVYFFKVGDKELFKIGKTKDNPEKRLKAVSTGSSYPLEIYKIIEHKDYSKLEVFLHRYFKDVRADNGEFFFIPLAKFDIKVNLALKEFEIFQEELKQIDSLKNIKNNDTTLEATQQITKIYSQLVNINYEIKDLKEKQERLENKLKLAISENKGIKNIATWTTQKKEQFDKQKYEKDHPQEYKKYTTIKYSRVLRIK